MPAFTAFLLTKPNFLGYEDLTLKALAEGDGETVTLEANGLEDVYAQLNHGSGRELKGYKGRSLSVGDVVVDPRRRTFFCASNGWSAL